MIAAAYFITRCYRAWSSDLFHVKNTKVFNERDQKTYMIFFYISYAKVNNMFIRSTRHFDTMIILFQPQISFTSKRFFGKTSSRHVQKSVISTHHDASGSVKWPIFRRSDVSQWKILRADTEFIWLFYRSDGYP